MPAINTPVACGIELSDPNIVAQKAVASYREHLFMRSFHVQNPSSRTLLTALYFVQDALSSCKPDGQITHCDQNILVPGDHGFPGVEGQVGPFSEEERAKCREYLGKLRAAVREQLGLAINKNEEVRKWWLSVQRRRFMNRMV